MRHTGSVVLFFLSKMSAANLYKREYVEESEWSAYHTENGVRSLLQCAALCQLNPNCGLFQHDQQALTCELGSGEAGCFYHKPENIQGSVLVLHRNLDILLKPAAPETQDLTRTSTTEDKINWDLLGSSIWQNTHYESFAVDGITHPSYYQDIYASQDAEHPWFRIDLGRMHVVKGARITIRNGQRVRLAFTEMRVGDQKVDETPESEMICKNQLCYMIGNNDIDDLSFDCASPISGRIVTLQKYNHEFSPSNTNRILEFTEIFLVVFCGPLSKSNGKCMYGEQNTLDVCAVNEQFKDSTTYYADASEKQNWLLTTGPLTDGFSLDVLTDGVLTGVASDQSYFHSPEPESSKHYSYPWVQIDFTTLKVVKGVHLYGRTDTLQGIQILYTEVRVGNVDVGAITPIGQRICANALCKTTGGGAPLPNQLDDCSGGPIIGRYVTVQRYRGLPDLTYPALVMAELDVQFYNQ